MPKAVHVDWLIDYQLHPRTSYRGIAHSNSNDLKTIRGQIITLANFLDLKPADPMRAGRSKGAKDSGDSVRQTLKRK